MTPEVAVCLLILACAVVLFASERVPADVLAMGVMLALIVTGLLGWIRPSPGSPAKP